MDVIDSLRSKLEMSFPLRTFSLPMGGLDLSMTTAEDIEELIHGITEEEFQKDERLPYWAEVWHSAVALGTFLREHPFIVDSKNILEIGCGLGAPGIVAASLGGRVTFSDYDRHALVAAELNFRTNIPDGSAEFLEMDFRFPFERFWDVILAADVIYEKRFIEPLAAFLDSSIDPTGMILLAEPNRLIAAPFFEELTKRGFLYERFERYATLHSRSVDVSIYKIYKRGCASPSLSI